MNIEYKIDPVTFKPDGVDQLEDLKDKLANFQYNQRDVPYLYKAVDCFIQLIENIITILLYKSRLPLYQMEQEIINMCRKDKTLSGVTVQIHFANKAENIDGTRMGHLTIYI